MVDEPNSREALDAVMRFLRGRVAGMIILGWVDARGCECTRAIMQDASHRPSSSAIPPHIYQIQQSIYIPPTPSHPSHVPRPTAFP